MVFHSQNPNCLLNLGMLIFTLVDIYSAKYFSIHLIHLSPFNWHGLIAGMVLVRSESGQLLMIHHQTLAQMQAQSQSQSAMTPRPATPTSTPSVQLASLQVLHIRTLSTLIPDVFSNQLIKTFPFCCIF